MLDSSLLHIACHEVGVAHCFMDGGSIHTHGRIVFLYSILHLIQHGDGFVRLPYFRQQQSVVDDLRDAVMTGE